MVVLASRVRGVIVLTTTLSSVFQDLIEALASADPEKLEIILQNPRYELLLALASHQKVLGEALTQLDEVGSDTVEQIGWLLIAVTEIAICWKRLT